MAKSLFYLDVVNFSKHHMDPQVSGKFQEATYSTDFPQPQSQDTADQAELHSVRTVQTRLSSPLSTAHPGRCSGLTGS